MHGNYKATLFSVISTVWRMQVWSSGGGVRTAVEVAFDFLAHMRISLSASVYDCSDMILCFQAQKQIYILPGQVTLVPDGGSAKENEGA
jgi:hypothetical protein